MDCNIYCVVDARGHVYVKPGAVSYAEVAASAGLDALTCDTYRFDLAARRLVVDRGTPENDKVARAYCEQHVGSPERLMTYAADGGLTKQVLGSLLGTADAQSYVAACMVIEKRYTAECGQHNPCLETGCAAAGEICLEPLLAAGEEYFRACGAAWNTLFEDPRHRTAAWMH